MTYPCYRQRLFAPDGPAGGGGQQQQQTAGGEQQQQERQPAGGEGGEGGGGDENFLETNANLWDLPARSEETPQETAAREQLQRDRSQQTNSRLDSYVNGLDFKFELKPETITEFFDNRDPKGLAAAVNGSLRAAYRNMMLDATRMVDGAMGQLRREMSTAADQRIRETESVTSLMSAVPFANTPALKPVAIAIQKQFLQKGKTLEEANVMVRRFFKETAQAAAPDLDLDIAPLSADGGGRTNGTRGNARGRASEIDWAGVLTGKP